MFIVGAGLPEGFFPVAVSPLDLGLPFDYASKRLYLLYLNYCLMFLHLVVGIGEGGRLCS